MDDATPEEIAYVRALYDEEVRHMDDHLGRLLAGCGRTPAAGADLGFGGRFGLEVERKCASG
jgi:hypothetical protein